MNLHSFQGWLRAFVSPSPPAISRILTLLTLGLLLLAGLKFTLNLESFMDISMYDEANYLQRGVNLMEWGVSHPSIGPLYSAWYYLLSLFEPDRVALHYLNYRLLVILLPVMLFVVLRRYHAPRLLALLVSFWLLIIELNLSLWPKVNHFAALVLLVFLAVGARRPLLDQIGIFAIGFLVAGYVRPELFGPALVLMIAGVILGVSRRYPLSSLRWVALAWILVGLLRFGYGLPTDANRSYLAFGQHFAINWVSWNESELNPRNSWEPIYQETFGSTDSVVIAAAQNPTQFFHHVLTNIQILPPILAYQYLKHPGIVLPDNQTRAEVVLIGVGVLLTLVLARRLWLPFVSERRRVHTPLFMAIAVLLGITLFQWLVIYPRPHYLLLPGIGFLIIGTLLVSGDPAAPDRTTRLAVAIALLLLILVPSTYDYSGPYAGSANRRTVALLRDVPLSTAPINGMERISIIEAEGGLDHYLGTPYLEVGEYEKDRGFAAFLTYRDIAAVVLSPRLAADAGFKDDPEWRDFVANPEKYGFFTMPIPETDRTLFVAQARYQGSPR